MLDAVRDFSQILQARGAYVTALDLCRYAGGGKNKQAAHRYVCGDMDALPFADASFDWVFSNLAIQWCQHLPHALSELYRVTKPGGVVGFTTLAGTLWGASPSLANP